MQISLLLDRFQVQLTARAQLHPLDDFIAWVGDHPRRGHHGGRGTFRRWLRWHLPRRTRQV